MEKKRTVLGCNTVRKKALALSKLAGGAIVLFYLLTEELPTNQSVSFGIWLVLLVLVIFSVDFLLGRLISKPLRSINDTAKKMAELDVSAHCSIHTNDEFGQLSQSLNAMFSNLQDALKKLEEANTQLEKDVEQKRILLEQRKELSDSLSHEMKTPLGLIRAYTEGLQDEDDPEKKRHYMDTILEATERMDNMIVSLLDLSALEAGAAKLSEERFDFVELVETVAGRLLMDMPGTDHLFHYEIPDHKIFVFADKRRMEQVLNNLIENAKKYVKTGGKIRLTVNHEGDVLYFSVFNHSDTIKEQDLSKIWGKFYRVADQPCKGSGLGLAIASQILSMHHAPYGVRSVGGGIEFFFRISTVV